MVPLSMHADFRCVFPLLVVVVVHYAKLVEHWQTRARPLFVLGAFLGTSMAASSVLLFRPSAARATAHEEPAFEWIERSLAEPSDFRLAGSALDEDAYQVTVRALESDGYYALGHRRLAQ